MNAIEVDALQVQKAKQVILKPLTFTIQRGAITGLVGPSGSGKTTLLRVIIGVQKPTSGTVRVFNETAGSATLRPRIGYVTQSPAIYRNLTVRQNLEYFAVLTCASKPDVERILREVQLEQQQAQRVDTLSGGQEARVSLAIALLGDPELLVLDEPTVGLDPFLRRDLWALFHQLAQQGKTLLISSHAMDEAEQCDSLILIREGAVIWADTPQRLLNDTNQSNVEAAFIAKVEGQ